MDGEDCIVDQATWYYKLEIEIGDSDGNDRMRLKFLAALEGTL